MLYVELIILQIIDFSRNKNYVISRNNRLISIEVLNKFDKVNIFLYFFLTLFGIGLFWAAHELEAQNAPSLKTVPHNLQ